MKIAKYLILSLLVFGFMTSCKPDNKSKKPGKAKTTQVSKKKGAKKGPSIWAAMKKKLSLSDDQVKKVQAISSKYNKKVSELKKAKKWDGDKNKKVREKVGKDRIAEIRKVLGTKTESYQKFMKDWTAKKSKPKAKKKGAKKPVKKTTKKVQKKK